MIMKPEEAVRAYWVLLGAGIEAVTAMKVMLPHLYPISTKRPWPQDEAQQQSAVKGMHDFFTRGYQLGPLVSTHIALQFRKPLKKGTVPFKLWRNHVAWLRMECEKARAAGHAPNLDGYYQKLVKSKGKLPNG